MDGFNAAVLSVFCLKKNVFLSSFPLILPDNYDKLFQYNLGWVDYPDLLPSVNTVKELQIFFSSFSTLEPRQDLSVIQMQKMFLKAVGMFRIQGELV